MSQEPRVGVVAYGHTNDGEAIDLFTLSNGRGIEVEILNFGGIVRAIRVPDREGRIDDVVLGFDSLDGYLGQHPYFGAIIGRFGNRIAGGRFQLGGQDYVLACNDGAHHLHGGVRGFDRVCWSAETLLTEAGPSLVFRHTSPDGDEGYPGTLACEVQYSLTTAGEFRIDYAATTDEATVLNLTHHSYFNLTGRRDADILSHEIRVFADEFLPVALGLIPTGERRSVIGTPFDLRESVAVRERMSGEDPQLTMGRGYDHNFILRGWTPGSSTLLAAARVTEPLSGRVLEVHTTEPGLQVYAGGALDGTLAGKGGGPYRRHAGLCLETQHFPDSPNHPEFPSVRLDPGSTYRSATVYRFSTTPSAAG